MSTSDDTANEKTSEVSGKENPVEMRDITAQKPAQTGPPNSTQSVLKDHPIWLFFALLIPTIMGNGAFWQWRSSVLAMKDSALKQQEANIAKVVETTALRRSENDIYRQIIELSQTYGETRDAYAKAPSSITQNKMIVLTRQLELLKSDFLILEKQLAELEKRTPRPIAVEFIPPPAPTSLRIVK